jgi:hypothetical protein
MKFDRIKQFFYICVLTHNLMTGKFARISIIILLIIVCSCKNNTKKTGDIPFPVIDSVTITESEKLSEEAIADIVQNVSAPIEVAAMLHSLSIPFSADYISTTRGTDQLTTNFEKAMMLGIYGADLGYLNIYEKTGNSIETISSIKQLADGLRVGQFFDYESIKRLSLNKSNIDSLLYISVSAYNKIDEYLRSNDRGSLSALMITGVWLEGEYFASRVITSYPDNKLKDRIGEQKIILNDLLMLLRPYKDTSKEYGKLYEMMEQLSNQYREIRITYTIAKPQTVEQNGRLVLIQKEESVVEMTDEQLKKIVGLTLDIRNKLISGE